MADKEPKVTQIRCLGLGHPGQDDSYLSITRTDSTTERFKLTPSIVALLTSEFAQLNHKWNKPDAA